MNCKRCDVLLTKEHEATLCTRCGQAILNGAPVSIQENPFSMDGVFGDLFGGKGAGRRSDA